MCKKFKFDHAKKWYMHNPAYVLENETHKLLWDFDMQTDHLILAIRPDLVIINKKRKLAKLWTLLKIKLNKCEKKDKYLNLASELKKGMEHEGDNYTNRDWYFWYSHQRIIKRTRGLGNERTSGDHQTYIIVNGQFTVMSWRLEETCCHSNSSEKPSAESDVKNSQGVNNYELAIFIIGTFY